MTFGKTVATVGEFVGPGVSGLALYSFSLFLVISDK